MKKFYVAFIINGTTWSSDEIEIEDPEKTGITSEVFKKVIVSRMNKFSAIYDSNPFIVSWSEMTEAKKKPVVYTPVHSQDFYDNYEDWGCGDCY